MGFLRDRSKSLMLFGNVKSGKSELLKKLVDSNAEYAPGYDPTRGPSFAISETDEFKYHLYDMGGDPRYRPVNEPTYSKIDLALYCIDLSVALDEAKLADDIQRFKAKNTKAKLILVGTKSDVRDGLNPSQPSTTDHQLNELVRNKDYGFVDVFITSSLNNTGVSLLKKALPGIINAAPIEPKPQPISDTDSTQPVNIAAPKIPEGTSPNPIVQGNDSHPPQVIADEGLFDDMDRALRWPRLSESPLLHESLLHLKTGITDLPQTIKDQIGTETLNLLANLNKKNDPDYRFKVIGKYQENCNRILDNAYPKTKSLIVGVVVAAIVTVLAAAIGFGIGFLAGAWTGPGAFITGVMAGSAAATAVVTSSPLVGSGLGLFAANKHRNTMIEANKTDKKLVKNVATEAKNEIKP